MSLEEIKPDFVVDARGTACPGPILEAKRSISKVPVGGILEVISTDTGTLNDLPIWVKRVGHEYLGSLESEGFYRLFIKRGK